MMGVHLEQRALPWGQVRGVWLQGVDNEGGSLSTESASLGQVRGVWLHRVDNERCSLGPESASLGAGERVLVTGNR